MKTLRIPFGKKMLQVSIGIVSNQSKFEDAIKNYLNNRYPRIIFDRNKSFKFNYSRGKVSVSFPKNKDLRVSVSTLNESKKIAILYGYNSISFSV